MGPLKNNVQALSMSGAWELLSRKDEPAEVMKAFLENQPSPTCNTIDVGSGPTDVVLILADGVIPAHGAILCGSSPFFSSIFEMQGLVTTPVREILMPEFQFQTMQKVIQLVYNPEVYVTSEKDMTEVRELLKYLEINVESKLCSFISKSSAHNFTDEDRVALKPQIVDLEVSDVLDSSELNLSEVSSGCNMSTEGDVIGETDERRSSPKIPRKTSPSLTASSQQVSSKVNGKKIESESESESVAESDSNFERPSERLIKRNTIKRKERGRQMSCKVKLPKFLKSVPVNVEKLAAPLKKSPKRSSSELSSPPTKKRLVASKGRRAEEYPEDTDSSTDYEADESRYKNLTWFLGEAKRCQKCKTNHESPALASGCLTGHSRLRCYFCFRVVKNTEMLFDHFQRAHKKGGRENFVECPFCHQSIPFKSVSCHVISMHLTSQSRNKNISSNQEGTRRSAFAGQVGPRRSAIAGQVGPARPALARRLAPVKQSKLADTIMQDVDSELTVGNLDCTIRHVKKNGKTWVFVLRKSRA